MLVASGGRARFRTPFANPEPAGGSSGVLGPARFCPFPSEIGAFVKLTTIEGCTSSRLEPGSTHLTTRYRLLGQYLCAVPTNNLCIQRFSRRATQMLNSFAPTL